LTRGLFRIKNLNASTARPRLFVGKVKIGAWNSSVQRQSTGLRERNRTETKTMGEMEIRGWVVAGRVVCGGDIKKYATHTHTTMRRARGGPG